MTFDYFYIAWSFVVPPVDHLNMNKTINYFSNKIKGCCIAQKHVVTKSNMNIMK